jgi:predicted dienelactone hydrolase
MERATEREQRSRVGHRVIQIVHRGSAGERRPIDVHLWYPADERSYRSSEPTMYRSRWYGVPLRPGIWDPLGVTVTSSAAREGADIARRGRYPFLLLSHGSGNSAADYAYICENVASDGYVVASADHTGNSFDDVVADVVNATARATVLTCLDDLPGPCPDGATVTLRNRARDLTATLDTVGTISRTLFRDAIDLGRIGIMGHSRGAQSALIMASGSSVLGIEPDPRVRGVVTIAAPVAAAGITSVDRLADLRAPVLLLHGLLDKTVLPSVGQIIFDGAVNASRILITFPAAHHRSFNAISCDRMQSAGGLVRFNPHAFIERVWLQDLLINASGSTLDYCRYQDFVLPVDITGVVHDVGGFAVAPDNVPRSGLAAADASRLASALIVRFFDEVLENDERRCLRGFRSPEFALREGPIAMNIQLALASGATCEDLD